MTTFDSGRQAEQVAADFLVRQGCVIVARNWRTRMCEIDVIAERGGILYFCEVKYRRSISQGSGIEYVTPKKVQQMRFAAASWMHVHGWEGESELCAIEVSGTKFKITNVVKDI
ncbi:MAG: YraN family protein [Candidatus Saccharibacteria bacterium]